MVPPSDYTVTPAGFRRNAWLASIGTGGWFRSESMAGIAGIRTPEGILIMSATPRRARRATPRSAGQHHPCRRRSAPPHRQARPRSPARQTPCVAPLPPERLRSRSERSRALPLSQQRSPSPPHGASPAEYLLRADLPAPRNLGHTRSWHQGLRDDPCLLIRRPRRRRPGPVRTSIRRIHPSRHR